MTDAGRNGWRPDMVPPAVVEDTAPRRALEGRLVLGLGERVLWSDVPMGVAPHEG